MAKKTGQQAIVLWEMKRHALHEAEKLISKGEDVDEFLNASANNARMLRLLGLENDQTIPPSFIKELKERINRKHQNDGQVQNGARGIFNVLQMLTTLIASWSLLLNNLVTSQVLEKIAYAVVGAVFLVVNIVYILKTRKILKHERR